MQGEAQLCTCIPGQASYDDACFFVCVLQVEFEQFKNALILVLSSADETSTNEETPAHPGTIITS